MRYFTELAYNGTRFKGYQIQPNVPTVQQAIEDALSMVLRQRIAVLGCGRTDTGVHAEQYFIHWDYEGELPHNLLFRSNRILGGDIALRRLIPVAEDAHARFDAKSRSYRYELSIEKQPFRQETCFFCPRAARADRGAMQATAELLLNYEAFAPFCKSKHGAKTYLCALRRAEWSFEENHFRFHITANRFLRGMVRLIVGACLEVGWGRMSLEDIRHAMERQQPLKHAYSAPAEGLFLTDIQYDFIKKSL